MGQVKTLRSCKETAKNAINLESLQLMHLRNRSNFANLFLKEWFMPQYTTRPNINLSLKELWLDIESNFDASFGLGISA